MRTRSCRLALAASMAAALVHFVQPAAVAQTPAQAKAWTGARTPDGQPDIQGFWTEEPGTNEAVNIETALQTADSLRVTGWTEERLKARKAYTSIIDPPSGKVPYQPWAEARRQQILSRYGGDNITDTPKGERDVSPELLCIIGAPRAMYFADFRLIQTKDHIVMTWERSGEFRTIPLTAQNRPPLPEAVKLHMGDSRGTWEGDTLVIRTTNMNDWSWFDSKGTPHSDAMTLVERLTPVDEKTVKYVVTVTDPKALSRPFTMAWTLKKVHGIDDGYEQLETACVEGERSLNTVLGREEKH
jgi:hypothetical protein